MSEGKFGAVPAISLEVFGGNSARTSILRARDLGFPAVGIPAARREFEPQILGSSGAKDLGVFLRNNGLSASWVWAGAKARLTFSRSAEEDIARMIEVIELSEKLRAGAAAVQVGQLGTNDSVAATNLREALASLAPLADKSGVTLALASTPGEEKLIDGVLKSFDGGPIGRLLNPGATLFAGYDPVHEIEAARQIAGVRASDSSGEETALAPGEGRVAWRQLLAALAARDYHGYVTVDFAPRGDVSGRAATALALLRRYSIS